jgi:putative Holliday junction resolvase
LIKRKRILALDVGLKRIGIAQSDPMFTIASPIGAFGKDEVFIEVEKIAKQCDIEMVIIGWPVHLSGDAGTSVKMVENFRKEFEKKFPDLKTDVLDERFTSSMAKQAILDSGVNKKRRQDKGLVDAVAAAILLQNYLDKQKF